MRAYVSCLPGMFISTSETLTLSTGQGGNVMFVHSFCQILCWKKSAYIFWIEINGAALIIPHRDLSW